MHYDVVHTFIGMVATVDLAPRPEEFFNLPLNGLEKIRTFIKYYVSAFGRHIAAPCATN